MSGKGARFQYKQDLVSSKTSIVNTARTQREHVCNLDVDRIPRTVRGTGIICTIGPSCMTTEKLTEMIHNGMNIARMNFSHGSYEYHQSVIDNVRAAAALELPHPVAIALDTKGPEIRTGMMKSGGDTNYLKGHTLKVTSDEAFREQCDENLLFLEYPSLCKSVRKGSTILIGDGLLMLEVVEVADDHTLITTICNNAQIGSRKNCNLPGAVVDLPAVSKKDADDLRFGVKNNVDMIFASFIRKKEDVQEVRQVLGEDGKHIKIIAKIENQEGIHNINDIIEESDGVMVARGDLGMEIPLEKVFVAQKMIIARCNMAGKPVICATQMLESMVVNPRPTRAEASDVANAVLDGADCVMLSGETAKGDYPVEAVTVMHKVCREAEESLYHRLLYDELKNVKLYMDASESVAISAVSSSFKMKAAAIVVLTTSGVTGHLLSQYRPRCPIIVVTRTEHVGRQCHLYRGLFPLQYNEPRAENWGDDVDKRLQFAIHKGVDMGFVQAGSFIIFVCGWKPGKSTTNTVRILQLDESDVGSILGRNQEAVIKFRDGEEWTAEN